MSVAFVCLHRLQYLSEIKKEEKKNPTFHFLHFFGALFSIPLCLLSIFKIRRQAIIPFVTLETSLLFFVTCVLNSFSLGATVLLFCLRHRPFFFTPPSQNICNLEYIQVTGAVKPFLNIISFSYLNMSSFFSVTSVVCDIGQNTVYIPTQRKINKSILENKSEIDRVEDFVAMLVTIRKRHLCI